MHEVRAERRTTWFIHPAGIVKDAPSILVPCGWFSDLETKEDVVMSINFRCPHCQLPMTASDDRAGAVVDCPRCQGAMRIDLTAARVPPSAASSKPVQSANDPFSFIEPEPLLDKKPKRGRPVRAVATLSVGVVGLILAVYGTHAASLLSLWDLARNVGVPFRTDHTVSTAATHDDDSFSISVSCFQLPVSTYDLHYFEIIINSQAPVLVRQVVYNGVYEPRIDPTPFGRGKLVLNVGWPKRSVYSAFELDHIVEFIDIHTDQGSFRFDPGGELIGQSIGQPRADLKRLTQEQDAQIEAKEKAIVDARRAMVKEGDVSNPLLKRYSAPLERFAAQLSRDSAKANRELRARLNDSPGRRRPSGAPGDD